MSYSKAIQRHLRHLDRYCYNDISNIVICYIQKDCSNDVEKVKDLLKQGKKEFPATTKYERYIVYRACEQLKIPCETWKKTEKIEFSCKDWGLYGCRNGIVANKEKLCKTDEEYEKYGIYECCCDEIPSKMRKYRGDNNYDDTQAYFFLYHTTKCGVKVKSCMR